MQLKGALLFIVCFLNVLACYGQIVTECPRNIGFELGSFVNWECSAGEISGTGNRFPDGTWPPLINLFNTSPVGGTHTLIRSGTDPFGGFPLKSPNGSNYVVKLGNEINGRGAESISYTLDVPSNVEAYSVVFNYAVVFEDPGHAHEEQPKFTAKVIDLSTNTFTECGSFEFVAQGGLPGFHVSPIADSVLYKPWSPVMVNLSNYLGHKIRLEFTTNDCSRGRHFGYAYIDFNENCSIPVIGNVTCPDNNSVTLEVISGFSQYRWYELETHTTLGTSEQLTLSPVPPVGTRIAVELVPYDGLGCTQTLYTSISDISMSYGIPPESCHPVDITQSSFTIGNSSDLGYSYWKDAAATLPVPDPKRITQSGTYYVKGTSSSGCSVILPVPVVITSLPPIVVMPPPPVIYPVTVDLSTTFIHEPGFTYSYWKDLYTTVPLNNPERVRLGGTFYIKGENAEGCFVSSPVTATVIIEDIVVPNAFTPNGDGVNDVFTILFNSGINIKNLRIFNRWGEVVYETVDITRYWTGFKENASVPAGVYYWMLEGMEKSGSFRRSGYVTVIR